MAMVDRGTIHRFDLTDENVRGSVKRIDPDVLPTTPIWEG
jgi:hypothetical protein